MLGHLLRKLVKKKANAGIPDSAGQIRRAMRERRWDDARQLLEARIGVVPSDRESRIELGICLHGLGELQRARELYQGVLNQEPDHSHVRLNLALTHMECGNFAAAIPQLDYLLNTRVDDILCRKAFIHKLEAQIKSNCLPERDRIQRPSYRDDTLISVVMCSIDDARYNSARRTYEASLAGGPFEILRIGDAKSLCEGYNRGLTQAKGEVVVFSHDDVEILSSDFRRRLVEALREYDMVGVAGTTRLEGPAWLLSPPETLCGAVVHPSADGKCCVCVYGPAATPGSRVEALDGLFIAAKKDAAVQVGFDETTFDGFHLYDLDFTYSARRQGVRIGVRPDLGLYHFSAGQVNSSEWREYARRFCQKHGFPMPRKLMPAEYSEITFATRTEAFQFLNALYASLPLLSC